MGDYTGAPLRVNPFGPPKTKIGHPQNKKWASRFLCANIEVRGLGLLEKKLAVNVLRRTPRRTSTFWPNAPPRRTPHGQIQQCAGSSFKTCRSHPPHLKYHVAPGPPSKLTSLPELLQSQPSSTSIFPTSTSKTDGRKKPEKKGLDFFNRKVPKS